MAKVNRNGNRTGMESGGGRTVKRAPPATAARRSTARSRHRHCAARRLALVSVPPPVDGTLRAGASAQVAFERLRGGHRHRPSPDGPDRLPARPSLSPTSSHSRSTSQGDRHGYSIYAFDGGRMGAVDVRRLSLAFRDVSFVDVAAIDGRDRLITYEPGRHPSVLDLEIGDLASAGRGRLPASIRPPAARFRTRTSPGT